MSESSGFATREAFSAKSGKRRFKEHEVTEVGKVILGSFHAGQFARIDAARSRATMAGMQGNAKEQVIAMNDMLVELFVLGVLDGDHNPFFTYDDRAFILALDANVTNDLVAALVEHSNLDRANVEELEKNLPSTSGVSSPT